MLAPNSYTCIGEGGVWKINRARILAFTSTESTLQRTKEETEVEEDMKEEAKRMKKEEANSETSERENVESVIEIPPDEFQTAG